MIDDFKKTDTKGLSSLIRDQSGRAKGTVASRCSGGGVSRADTTPVKVKEEGGEGGNFECFVDEVVQSDSNVVSRRLSIASAKSVVRGSGVSKGGATEVSSLNGLELNKAVTQSYNELAARLQGILDPDFVNQGVSHIFPTWFSFGAFASRRIGESLAAAFDLLELLGVDGRVAESDSGQGRGVGQEHDLNWENIVPPELMQTVDKFFDSPEEKQLGALLCLLWGERSIASMDVRSLVVSTYRLMRLVQQTPGATLQEKLSCIIRTLVHTLEDGSRRIHAELAKVAGRYLNFREHNGGRVSPEEVVVYLSSHRQQSLQVYQKLIRFVDSEGELPEDMNRMFPEDEYDYHDILAAAYGLYEAAAQSDDVKRKNRCIQMAVIATTYPEQRIIARPAYHPGRILPGEVSRELVMQLITPSIKMPTRAPKVWKYAEFAEDKLPARDHNPLTPRVTEYNWARFDDRWPGIMDYYRTVYAHPESVWPPPCPDPKLPM